jgi:L-ascorbate oxidase
MLLPRFHAGLLVLLSPILVFATTKVHDQTFVPDIALRVSEDTVQQACLPAKPIVVINGTSPGPPLRIVVERTYWIRVYNDLKDKNTTMVSWHAILNTGRS